MYYRSLHIIRGEKLLHHIKVVSILKIAKLFRCERLAVLHIFMQYIAFISQL